MHARARKRAEHRQGNNSPSLASVATTATLATSLAAKTKAAQQARATAPATPVMVLWATVARGGRKEGAEKAAEVTVEEERPVEEMEVRICSRSHLCLRR